MLKFEFFLLKCTKKDKNRISKLLSMNCAGQNPNKLCRYKQYSYIIKMKKNKWNEIVKLREKMNYYTISGMKDLLKELSFFISNILA